VHSNKADSREESEGHIAARARRVNSHKHISWFGGLVCGFWGFPGTDVDSTGNATSDLIVVADRGPQARHSVAMHPLLKNLHGPPEWRLGHDVARSVLRSHGAPCPAPPLCDVARHERSGVQVI
jgi:hypothetical protein